MDRRAQGGGQLIPVVAELHGRDSSGCWLKFEFNVLQNPEDFINWIGLESAK